MRRVVSSQRVDAPCRIGLPCCTRRLLPLHTCPSEVSSQRRDARQLARCLGWRQTCSRGWPPCWCVRAGRGRCVGEQAVLTHRPTILPSTTRTAPTGMPPSNMPFRAWGRQQQEASGSRQARCWVPGRWRENPRGSGLPRVTPAHAHCALPPGHRCKAAASLGRGQGAGAHLLNGLVQELLVIGSRLRDALRVPLASRRRVRCCALRLRSRVAGAPWRPSSLGTGGTRRG